MNAGIRNAKDRSSIECMLAIRKCLYISEFNDQRTNEQTAKKQTNRTANHCHWNGQCIFAIENQNWTVTRKQQSSLINLLTHININKHHPKCVSRSRSPVAVLLRCSCAIRIRVQLPRKIILLKWMKINKNGKRRKK